MANYEAGKVRFTAALLPVLAETLELSIEELIGPEPKTAPGKSSKHGGPTPKIQQQLERIARLPRAKQQVVVQMLDGMLVQASR